MTVSQALIVGTGVAYLIVSADSGLRGAWGPAVMYAGYALANVGAWLMLPK